MELIICGRLICSLCCGVALGTHGTADGSSRGGTLQVEVAIYITAIMYTTEYCTHQHCHYWPSVLFTTERTSQGLRPGPPGQPTVHTYNLDTCQVVQSSNVLGGTQGQPIDGNICISAKKPACAPSSTGSATVSASNIPCKHDSQADGLR